MKYLRKQMEISKNMPEESGDETVSLRDDTEEDGDQIIEKKLIE